MSSDPIVSNTLIPPAGAPGRRASDVLMAAAVGAQSRSISFAELVEALGERGFGLVLILLGLVDCVPLPPGISSLVGIPLLLVALQMLVGRHMPWLPQSIGRRELRRSDVVRMVSGAQPLLLRIERLCRPRHATVFRVASTRVLGGFIALLALCVMIPLPFTNFLPSLATVVIAVAMIELDGLLLGLGVAFGVGAIAITVVVTAGVAGMLLIGLKALFAG
jgi:hypothetical protein